MSHTRKDSRQYHGGDRDKRISVRAVRRTSPDLRKLSRAVIQLAMAQAAAEAAAQHESRQVGPTPVDRDSEAAE
jgi:hypothetical protein